MTIVMSLFLLFVFGIRLLLCVEMWALLNPTSRRLAWGVVSLAMVVEPTFLCFTFL